MVETLVLPCLWFLLLVGGFSLFLSSSSCSGNFDHRGVVCSGGGRGSCWVGTGGEMVVVVISSKTEVLMATLRAQFSSLVVVSSCLSWVIVVASCRWMLLTLLNSNLIQCFNIKLIQCSNIELIQCSNIKLIQYSNIELRSS